MVLDLSSLSVGLSPFLVFVMMNDDLNKDVNMEHQSVDGGFVREGPGSTLHPSVGEDVSMGSGGQRLISAATEGAEPGDGSGEMEETTSGGNDDDSGKTATGKGGVWGEGPTFGIKGRGVSTADSNQPEVKKVNGKKAITEEPKNLEDTAGDDLQLSEGSLNLEENEESEESAGAGVIANGDQLNQQLLYKLTEDMAKMQSTICLLYTSPSPRD